MDKNKKKKSWTEILFFIYLIGGLITMLIIPLNFKFKKGGSYSSRQKSCYSNIRVIQGAVEMYNMDSSEMMSDLNIDDLKSGHYLKKEPVPPDKPCSYQGTDLDNDGNVYCTFHGDLQGITPGSYDGTDYMPFVEKVIRFLNGFFEDLPYGIFWPVVVFWIILQKIGVAP